MDAITLNKISIIPGVGTIIGVAGVLSNTIKLIIAIAKVLFLCPVVVYMKCRWKSAHDAQQKEIMEHRNFTVPAPLKTPHPNTAAEEVAGISGVPVDAPSDLVTPRKGDGSSDPQNTPAPLRDASKRKTATEAAFRAAANRLENARTDVSDALCHISVNAIRAVPVAGGVALVLVGSCAPQKPSRQFV